MKETNALKVKNFGKKYKDWAKVVKKNRKRKSRNTSKNDRAIRRVRRLIQSYYFIINDTKFKQRSD